jgi:FkbM family methyltransferase
MNDENKKKGMSTGAKWGNVIIENKGASLNKGCLELIIPTESGDVSPGATFEEKKKEELHVTRRVEVVSLDEYAKEKKLEKIDFIKCDVEGHELKVFKGAENILRKDSPALLFECERRHLENSETQDVFSFLQKLGYKGFFFANSYLEPLTNFDPEVHQKEQPGRFWEAEGYINNFAFKR